MEEVEAQELAEALKEENIRLRRYSKRFAIVAVLVALIVGLSVGLTRGKGTVVVVQEQEDICNYTNTRAAWSRSAVSLLDQFGCNAGHIIHSFDRRKS